MIVQGEVYLVDFAKKYNSEFGKVRPAVIMQNNFLNRALSISKFQSVLVVPLSTQDIQTEYKIEIEARDNLKEKSFIVANWVCTLDFKRIQVDKGLVTKLDDNELQTLKSKICDLI
ncbi:MAG: type II toxin-antitoxin system PemK/MazF family toxin [Campylobacterota bacterium]|nr:type II toxin-antitoxin system PemK/MazF family toxin [Campylobacterota bacterium]